MTGWIAAVLLGWHAAATAAAPPSVTQNASALTVSMRTAEDAVYPGQDLAVRLTFKNAGETHVTIPAESFSRETFEVADDRGRRPKPGREEEAAGSSGPLIVEGYGQAERVVSLSAWYPRVSARRGAWTIRWGAGPWSAGPVRAVVTRPYDLRRDRIALLDTDLGPITWELLPDHAPAHVKRFVDLSRQGFYDGLTLFRLLPHVQVEGGDRKGDGTGAFERLMTPEIASSLEITAGMVGAARVSSMSSMTSESMFFVTLAPAAYMQGKHTFFARLTAGWEVLARLGRLPNKGDNGMTDAFRLETPVTIRSVTIK